MDREFIEYETLLPKCCEKVYCFKRFGDYQGTALAKVKYNGKDIWLSIYYGSCSGCDPLQGFLSNNDIPACFDELDKRQLNKLIKWFKEACIEGDETPYEGIVKRFKEDSSWDMEAEEALKFLEENK